MDVSLWNIRFVLSVFIGALLFSACGNRYDLGTERGRRSRIDDANFHLSKGACTAAIEAIDPLYNSPHVNDEIRLIKASAHACAGTFNFLTLVSNLSGATNYFSVLAKSLSNNPGDGARSAFYFAVDVLTRNGSYINASTRSKSVNNYMVFLQLGLVGSILRNYGNPNSVGGQQQALVYETAGANPAGEMTNEDACALAAAFSMLSDSFDNSSLADGDSASAVNSINSVCVAAGLPSCSSINKNRSACDGTNADSVTAAAVVSGVNTSW